VRRLPTSELVAAHLRAPRKDRKVLDRLHLAITNDGVISLHARSTGKSPNIGKVRPSKVARVRPTTISPPHSA
jgi:hypothetical protein